MSPKDSSVSSFSKSRRWRAKWIWARGEGNVSNSYYYFRKTFRIEGPPQRFRLYIAADTRYQLFLNGRFVGRGAPQSQPFLQYYDEHDVDSYLKAGLNCAGVIVNYVGNLPDTRGGLLAEMVDGEGRTVLATGADWRATRARAWHEDTHFYRGNKATPYQEFFDARQAPRGWAEPSFDDAAWPEAHVLSGRASDRPPAVPPWSRLVPRDIPFMTADPVLPVRIERVEESLDLINRSRSNDLAPGLSMVGGPVQHGRVEGAENLCREEGDTIVQSSVKHLDLDFDGMHAPAIVLDFGRVISARAEINLCGVAGGMVDIGYAERLIDGHFNIAMECEFADRYIMADGEQTFESFTWKSFRYLKLRFRSCFQPVTVHSVRGIVSTYPYEERGGFESNDEKLNAVFEISRATLRLCSNEFLMDTPWREQAQWLGDVAAVTVPAIYACFGDPRLPGKFLRQAAANQHPTGMISNISNTVNHAWQNAIPDYSLWWIRGVWNHYMYTGEERWVHELYPQALRVAHAHMNYVNENGLIEDMPYHPFIDWADVDKRGECAAYNAIFYGALETVAKMARLKNDEYTRDLAERTMQGIRANFQKRLFDPKRGCCADANIDGVLSDKTSEHANAAAILWNLCDEAAARAIIATLWEKRSVKATEAQPFFMVVVLNALDRAGRFDLALRLIRERWGKRMVDRGATSVYEEWYQNGSWRSGQFSGFLRTHSHAWSACPAEFLIRNLMGLEILAPGCRRVRIRPQAVPFPYSATFPTPLGAIRVSREDGRVKTSAPKEIEVVG